MSKVDFKQRLRETEWTKLWSWNLFSMCMGSGAVMVCIYSIPYTFRGQHTLATIWFIIDIALFLLNVTMITLRAIKHYPIFKHSFYDHSETPWLPCVNLSMATILIGCIDLGIPYSGPWLITTCEVLYYVYLFSAIVTATIVQNTLRPLPRPLANLTPVDSLEAFPIMLAGTVGSLLCSHLNTVRPSGALTMMIFAIVCQGLGLFISILKLSAWMVHHLTFPRPDPATLPAYMIAAGVPGFTAFALVNTGHAARMILPANDFLAPTSVDPSLAGDVFFIVSVWFGFLMTGFFTWIALILMGWALFTAAGNLFRWKWGSYSYASTFVSRLTAVMVGLDLSSRRHGVSMGVWSVTDSALVVNELTEIGTIFVLCMWIFNMIGTVYLWSQGNLPGVAKEFDRARFEEELHADDLEPIRHRTRGDRFAADVRKRGVEDETEFWTQRRQRETEATGRAERV